MIHLAKLQMSGACELFTIILKTNKPDSYRLESIIKFCESLQHIMMAVSWGGHESLVILKCAGIQPKDFDPANHEHRYVRMYAGLEEPEYLVADLEQALKVI